VIKGMHEKYGLSFKLAVTGKPYFRLTMDKKAKKVPEILNETVILLESILSFL
jgi:hypothetical protein